MKVDVQISGTRVATLLATFGPKAQRAIRRSARRAGTSTRARIVQAIRTRYAISAGDLKRKRLVSLRYVGDGAAIFLSGRELPAIAFGKADQDASGANVTILKGTRTHIAHGFLARMPNGHKGVFFRLGKSRTPIAEVMGDSPPVMTERAGLPLEAVQRYAMNKLEQRLGYELDKILGMA